jgi:parvulin-like peptidyl-prolyl isomerase
VQGKKMAVLQLANRPLETTEIIPLLTQYQMIPHLLRESIIDQAIAPILCTPEEIAQSCEQVYQQWQLDTELKQTEWRSHYGLSLSDFETLATRPLRIEKFKQVMWGRKLESYFMQRKMHLDVVWFSLLRLRDRGVANELYFRILEGEQSFAEVARQYSEGAEAQTGGWVAPMEFGQMAPELADVLYTSPIGCVQPPVPMGEWQVIVCVEQRIPAQLDEPMRQRLLQEQFEQWLQSQMMELNDRDKVWLQVA